MPSSVERMKHLLSTGENSDVHFLVGDGDEKEILPSHQLILKNASNVFEAMFRPDAKKEQGENASAGCPLVKVADVEAAAFKVMLSFIYADDLDELDGNNAMALLYAAKKYNIPDLVDASLQIPISELRNVFFAFAQTRLFKLEDFSIKCLRYICQNAAKLFESNDFLQIDQEMLCVLLDSDLLLFSDEFEIWKTALRWADEKCRQIGIEYSSKNRRSLLGPALFKIRFPNIHEENFAKCVVPSDVLTVEEVLGVYQFKAHPFLYLRGVPGLYSLKFPSHGRIFNWNKAKDNRRGTLALEIEKMSEFAGESVGSRRLSDAVEINGLALKIQAEIRKKTDDTDEKKYLGFWLWCDAKEGALRNNLFSATFRIVSEKSEAENSIGTRCDDVFDSICQGFRNFITFAELMDPNNGFYNREEDKVTLTVDVIVKEAKVEKLILDQSKSHGTLFMEIEKVSEFAREINRSERKSETMYIKGFPWKILALIEKEDENIDNELNIFLLCDAPKEDKIWECKCSATLRILSQKNGAVNYIRTFCDHIFNIKSKHLGLEDITFEELMDQNNGFYNRVEDKLTLVIDVTVKDEKTEKCILDQSKSEGTLSMEIEKLSEFARESIGSERKSETVHIKGFPWKIWAQTITKKDNTDEKLLGFFLFCDAPEKDKYWYCKSSGTVRIVSQKNRVPDFKKEFVDLIVDNQNMLRCVEFISFAELMDPEKGFYNKSEDKVTLTIDVTVEEAKMEDNS